MALKKIQRAAIQQIRTVNRTLTTTIEDSDAFGSGDILFGSNVISDAPSRVDYLFFPPGSFE